MRKFELVFVGFAVVLAITLSIAFCNDACAQNIPRINAPVTDLANVLSTNEERVLSDDIRSHHERTGVQIAVVTISSLDGYPIEDYTMALADSWQGGSEHADDGVVIVISLGDRQSRIEVGYGLETDLLDSECRNILDESGSFFSRSDFFGGVDHIVSGVVSETLRGASIAEEEGSRGSFNMVVLTVVMTLIILVFLFVFVILPPRRR